MDHDSAVNFTKLVRDEADSRYQLQLCHDANLTDEEAIHIRQLKLLDERRDTILNVARTAALGKTNTTEMNSQNPEEHLQLLKADMANLFELLLKAPKNEYFQAKSLPEKLGYSSYRHITVNEFGSLEVHKRGDDTSMKQGQKIYYRLAIVGLPAAFSSDYSLTNSPILAELSLNTNESEDFAVLIDQKGTLKAVCEAASLIEASQTD